MILTSAVSDCSTRVTDGRLTVDSISIAIFFCGEGHNAYPIWRAHPSHTPIARGLRLCAFDIILDVLLVVVKSRTLRVRIVRIAFLIGTDVSTK